MPIPTDTYRNVRVLNWVFAGSALLLLLVMLASVIQDWNKTWREPQRQGRVWEAALTEDRIARTLSPQRQEELARINQDLAKKEEELSANRGKIDQLQGQVRKVRSDISTLEFSLNNLKSNVTVMEAQLEHARTAARTAEDRAHVRQLEAQIRGPRQQVARDTETIKAWEADVERLNKELGELTRERDALEKQKTRLEADEKALRKKKESLQPQRLDARLSQFIRGQPLLQFINPSEKVQQDVLPDVRTDVAFQKITTVDRCRTCHVNIDDREFTESNILAFLEKNVATARDLNLPGTASAKAAEPRASIDAPGAAALGEFWHAWAARLSPAAVRRNAARIKTLTDSVGKGVTLRVDGKALPAFSYDPALADLVEDPARERQDRVLGELLKAWARFEPKGDKKDAVAVSSESADRTVRVEILNGAANAPAVRMAALKYPEELRTAMEASLGKEQRRMLLDRYRRALAAVVNERRRDIGQPLLNDGRVMLAHPRLDLYVGTDSKHSYERVGCTSCHDGSGQETDFVLTAHTPRDIWVDQKTGAPVLPQQLVHDEANGNGEDSGHHDGPTLASMLEAVYPHGVLAPLGASSLHMPFAAGHGTGRGADGHSQPDSQHNASGGPAAPGPRAAATPDHSGQVIMAAAPSPAGGSASGSTPSQPSHGSTPAHGQGGGRGKTTPAHDSAPGADARPTAYVDPVTGQRGRAVPQIRYWAKKYELEAGTGFETLHHRWDWPMRAPQYIEANCVRCHTQVTDIREDAPTLNEGRTLFANLGCANCHQMDSIPAAEKRQVGTDLRHVNDKLSPAFINTWVWAPKAFRPSTKMPHFFMLENNSSDEELRRTRQEARAITEYLVASATPMPQRTPLPPTGKGSAEAGQRVFEAVGCQGCHVNLNAPTKTKGVTLGEQWVTQDLIKKGVLAEQLEPVVAREVAERMTRDLEATTLKQLEAAAQKTVTAEVTKELTPKRDPKTKPSADEAKKLKEQIAEEVKKRTPAAVEAAKKGLPQALDKARAELPSKIASAVPTELAKRVAADAKALYDRMTYNERQLYLVENLEPPTVLKEPDVAMPWRNEPPRKTPYDVPTYPDGTPKPVFMHHGPELSGIGTKLLAGRKPEEARAWLFAWLKEPHHYSSYTLMPNLRLTDQQALDVVEYLLAQTRQANRPDDAWKAELAPEDPAKLAELVAFFLRSRFSINTADQKAVEEFTSDGKPGEVTKLAVEALTTPVTPRADAEKRVAGMNLAQKQMVWLGKKLISHYGCMSCHQIHGMETATSPCANLSDWGQKGIDKLDFAYLDHHKHVGPHALPETANVPMVNGLSEHAANLVHAPVLNVTGGAKPEGSTKPQAAPNGGADHAISQLVAVGWPHVGHSREEWITQKLKNTRVYDRGKNLLEPDPRRGEDGKLENPGRPYDKLRMPTFYLNDQQVHAIVTFVISNRDRLVSDAITAKATTEESRQIAYGRHLTQKYNCVGCHQTERNAPSVQQYYGREELTTKAPPSLRGEGNKIQHDWLFGFLKDVEPLRPLPEIRMPSFRFDNDAEVTAIAAYFAAVSNREARELKRNLDPVLAHIESAKKAVAPGTAPTPSATGNTPPPATQAAPSGSANTQVAATQPATQAPAGSPAAAAAAKQPKYWFQDPSLEPQRRFLEEWALNFKQLAPVQINPANNPNPEDLDKGYATLLFKARFTAGLYDAPYPFDNTFTPRVDEKRFKLGEQLFAEMQCLKCHMMGPQNPNEKVPPSVVAPNLSLTADRLQRRWVRHWVQEPPIIQVGTAMPPFLSGLGVLALDGLSWPRSQQMNEAEVARIEKTYGLTADEQAALLLDFLYAAGVRNYTPSGNVAAAAAAPGGPAPLPQGQPPTATKPGTAGSQAPGSVAEAAGNPAPTQPGTNAVPPLKQQEMQNQQKPAPTVPTEKPAPAPAPPAPAAPDPGAKPQAAGPVAVAGKVVFNGEAPEAEQLPLTPECAAHHPDGAFAETLVVNENGTLKNVFVYVSSNAPAGAAPAQPAKLDQKGCQYVPHVVGVMVGQPLVISNSDPFLHNVHSLAVDNPAFNFGQPNVDPGRKVDPMKVPEVFKIKCDVHPWMGAFVHVVEHPFFAVTGDDGSFAITGLPPGQYKLTAWHETLGKKEIDVTVEAGKPAAAEFTFEKQ